ncbi:MAG: SpoIIE family protein phosphatase [Desulfobacterales bacterium]|nr:SpoIIE family protein phosphatase [Desulfobacterales bacterium]
MHEIDYYIVKRSFTGWDDECGDTGVVWIYKKQCFIALIDVLGHGPEAHEVAVLAENYILEHHHQSLVDIMNGLHVHLKGTRGAVAAMCRINLIDDILNYIIVGNISVRLYGTNPLRLISRDGIVGYMITNPKEAQIKLYPGDIIVLSSDGLREHFNLEDCPGILTGSAKNIASEMLNFLDKGNDDASCIVLRYGI